MVFGEVSQLDFSMYRVDWIRKLVSLLDDQEINVHIAACEAFERFVKSIPKDELDPLVIPLRRTIESTGAPGRTVPGFNLPKGVSPLVPIIIVGLTSGSNDQREQAAYTIGDLVERTDETAMKPFVVPFTGPLIRVATQATSYPAGVKILSSPRLVIYSGICEAVLSSTPTNICKEYIRSVQWRRSKKGCGSARCVDEESAACRPGCRRVNYRSARERRLDFYGLCSCPGERCEQCIG